MRRAGVSVPGGAKGYQIRRETDARMIRHRLAETCALYTPKIIRFWAAVLENAPVPDIDEVTGEVKRYTNGTVKMRRPYTTAEQFAASDRLMDRTFGKPLAVAESKDTRQELSVRRVEVKWLPRDPADTSKRIAPEPD